MCFRLIKCGQWNILAMYVERPLQFLVHGLPAIKSKKFIRLVLIRAAFDRRTWIRSQQSKTFCLAGQKESDEKQHPRYSNTFLQANHIAILQAWVGNHLRPPETNSAALPILFWHFRTLPSRQTCPKHESVRRFARRRNQSHSAWQNQSKRKCRQREERKSSGRRFWVGQAKEVPSPFPPDCSTHSCSKAGRIRQRSFWWTFCKCCTNRFPARLMRKPLEKESNVKIKAYLYFS